MNNMKIQAEEHLGLVRLCANRFRGRGIEYEDLYSAGCIGLLKAIKAFDAERGVKFSTYAVPVILGEIKRQFRDGGAIKVSRSVKELSVKLSKDRECFIKLYGYEPTISQLCERVNATESEVIEALSAGMPLISLTDTNEEGESQIDIPIKAPDEEIGDILSLRQVMSKMDKTDRMLLYLRYYKSQTQTQTAKALNMTQVQVSRREKKLLEIMRSQMLE